MLLTRTQFSRELAEELNRATAGMTRAQKLAFATAVQRWLGRVRMQPLQKHPRHQERDRPG